jgi:hypothetical protein
MKEPKNIRIILAPVCGGGRTVSRPVLEQIENTRFNNHNDIMDYLSHNSPIGVKILTADEFRKKLTKVPLSWFNIAMSNVLKKKQCYKLSDFMDEYNDQVWDGKTEDFWMGYVKVK